MSASYSVVPKVKGYMHKDTYYDKKYDFNTTPCFAPWYFEPEAVAEWKVYTPAMGESFLGRGNECPFTADDILTYAHYLTDMGFKFSIGKAQRLGKPAYVWAIESEANSPIANLILLNAIRYTYEDNMQFIVRDFLRFAEDLEDREGLGIPLPNELWNAFSAAHYGEKIANSNHAITQHYRVLMPLTPEEFSKLILHNETNVKKVNSNLKSTNAGSADFERLRKAISSGEPYSIIERIFGDFATPKEQEVAS